MIFDDVFKRHVAPKTVELFGGPAVYVHPNESDGDPVDLVFVIIGDVVRDKRRTEVGWNIFAIRNFQLITDVLSPRYCGIEVLAIGGSIQVAEDDFLWPIIEMPSVGTDGLVQVKCEKHLRLEIGNTRVRGS